MNRTAETKKPIVKVVFTELQSRAERSPLCMPFATLPLQRSSNGPPPSDPSANLRAVLRAMRPETYERWRSDLRHAMVALKQRRRVALGPHVTVLFENQLTIAWQILEILRVEGPWTSQRLERELAAYESLVPRGLELTATLFVDGGTPAQGRALSERIALGEAVGLESGRHQCWARARDRVRDPASAVHYLAFELDTDDVTTLRDRDMPVQLHLEGAEAVTVDLSENTRSEIATDLEDLISPSSPTSSMGREAMFAAPKERHVVFPPELRPS